MALVSFFFIVVLGCFSCHWCRFVLKMMNMANLQRSWKTPFALALQGTRRSPCTPGLSLTGGKPVNRRPGKHCRGVRSSRWMDQETEQSIKVLKTLRYSSHVHTVLVFDTISKLETGVRFACLVVKSSTWKTSKSESHLEFKRGRKCKILRFKFGFCDDGTVWICHKIYQTTADICKHVCLYDT